MKNNVYSHIVTHVLVWSYKTLKYINATYLRQGSKIVQCYPCWHPGVTLMLRLLKHWSINTSAVTHREFSHIGPIHVVIKVDTDRFGKWKTEWGAGNTGSIME